MYLFSVLLNANERGNSRAANTKNVTLDEDTEALEEVVVTAYGTQKKSLLLVPSNS